jgi:uncharacterized integral membrane protein
LLLLIALSVLLLAIAIFALENSQVISVHFLSWELQSSVAVVTIAATAAGVLIAGLIGLVSRLRRWNRGRVAAGTPLPSGPRSSINASAEGVDGSREDRSGEPGATRSVGQSERTAVR